MPIELIDKIKQKNNGTFKLIDDYDIEWHSDSKAKIPETSLPDTVVTKDDLTKAIADAPHVKRTIVTKLPEASAADDLTIYMVASGTETGNKYEEWVIVDGAWEKIGGSNVDLSQYYTKKEVDNKVTEVINQASSASTEAKTAETNANSYTDTKVANYLPLSGGTMTGALTLASAPTEDMNAATKAYVDGKIQSIRDTMTTSGDISTGTENGTIAVNGTDVAVKGLQSAAYVTVQDILDQAAMTWHDIPAS